MMRNTKTTFCEDIASDEGLGMTEIIEECGKDSASWKTGKMPNTITLRRMISLADWAVKNPKRWEAYRLYYFEGIQNTTRIAERLHCSERAVRRYLDPVRLAKKIKILTPPKPKDL